MAKLLKKMISNQELSISIKFYSNSLCFFIFYLILFSFLRFFVYICINKIIV